MKMSFWLIAIFVVGYLIGSRHHVSPVLKAGVMAAVALVQLLKNEERRKVLLRTVATEIRKLYTSKSGPVPDSLVVKRDRALVTYHYGGKEYKLVTKAIELDGSFKVEAVASTRGLPQITKHVIHEGEVGESTPTLRPKSSCPSEGPTGLPAAESAEGQRGPSPFREGASGSPREIRLEDTEVVPERKKTEKKHSVLPLMCTCVGGKTLVIGLPPSAAHLGFGSIAIHLKVHPDDGSDPKSNVYHGTDHIDLHAMVTEMAKVTTQLETYD